MADTPVATLIHPAALFEQGMRPLCHCEERRDEAISTGIASLSSQ
jgi:hypothetical protein